MFIFFFFFFFFFSMCVCCSSLFKCLIKMHVKIVYLYNENCVCIELKSNSNALKHGCLKFCFESIAIFFFVSVYAWVSVLRYTVLVCLIFFSVHALPVSLLLYFKFIFYKNTSNESYATYFFFFLNKCAMGKERQRVYND